MSEDREASRAPYRVIQWATGSVGREALRAILMHPALELAGVLVHSEETSGRDAGDLCGAPATGVLATSDRDAIITCDAVCVVYAPRLADLDEVCALLRAGKSVVCTPFLFHRRPHFISLASLRRRDATIDEHVQAANLATAMHAVNSIPALCAARPGWRSSVEPGLVTAGVGFRHASG